MFYTNEQLQNSVFDVFATYAIQSRNRKNLRKICNEIGGLNKVDGNTLYFYTKPMVKLCEEIVAHRCSASKITDLRKQITGE